MAANDVDVFVRTFLQRYAHEQDRVLDVGCGPAPYREWVAGSYIGLDITDQPYGPDMPRLVDVVGSAARLPLMTQSIDLMFSKSAFYLVPNPDAALMEFWRVLKIGGRVLLLDYNRRTQRNMMSMDGSKLPCWTQWGLKAKLKNAGFRQCEILVPTPRESGHLERWLRLFHQELFGTWAIVTGVK
ncbi:class I SAM-dependent methyltransferase [Bradyrhizobium sp.]|uniref:class I SAM-dependent methyltransferase n=1 Tax=Bradyrhizobium sp. TaxID=376 RepID=UPI003C7165B4